MGAIPIPPTIYYDLGGFNVQKDLYIPDGTVTDEILKQLIWDEVLPTARQMLTAWEPESRINEPTLLTIHKHTYRSHPAWQSSRYPEQSMVYYEVVFRSSLHKASKLMYKRFLNCPNPAPVDIISYNYKDVDTTTGLLR